MGHHGTHYIAANIIINRTAPLGCLHISRILNPGIAKIEEFHPHCQPRVGQESSP
jgi:hypothetical protein